MRPIVRFGLGLIIASLGIALLVSIYFLWNFGSISLTMLVFPSAGVVVGVGLMIGGFGTYLEIEDEIESFEHLVGDDIEDLMRGRITYTHVKLVGLIIAIITEVYLLFQYQKWTATWWGGVPVIIISVVCIGLVLYGGITMNWFQNRQRRTYWWVFAAFFIGWIASAYAGVYNTEPIEFGARSRIERQNYTYNYNTSRAGLRSNFSGVDIPSFNLPDCGDSDGCGAVLLFIVIVIIVVICIAASATIPHFWVLATCLLIAAMALVTLREWLVVETSHKGKSDYLASE